MKGYEQDVKVKDLKLCIRQLLIILMQFQNYKIPSQEIMLLALNPHQTTQDRHQWSWMLSKCLQRLQKRQQKGWSISVREDARATNN